MRWTECLTTTGKLIMVQSLTALAAALLLLHAVPPQCATVDKFHDLITASLHAAAVACLLLLSHAIASSCRCCLLTFLLLCLLTLPTCCTFLPPDADPSHACC